MPRIYLLAALALSAVTPAAAQPGVTYAAAAYTRCTALKAATGVRKGQQIACPADAPKAVLTPAPAPVVTPAPPAMTVPSPIGMNLVAPSYYSGASQFIDRMRDAGEWFVHYPGNSTGPKPGGYDKVSDLKLPVDVNGIPLAIPAGVENVALQIGYDPLDAGTTRRYVLLYEGTIQFIYGPGLKHIEDKPGRVTFEMSEFASQQLAFSGTFKDVHNIHIVREDQLDLFKAGKVFNPAFLDRVKLFSPIRFMDWQSTNGNQIVSWGQRIPASNYRWAPYNGTEAVPVEVLVQLANEAHVEPWFCIPAHADDDYVRRFVTYVRDNLAADLKPHFEYSNEVWNGSFEQSNWAASEANRLWGTSDRGLFYGYRAAQVAAIVRSIMGDRARTVVGGWTTWPAYMQAVFQGIAKVGDTSKLFDEYAITTYWGGAFAGFTPGDIARVVGWAKGGQAGVEAAFDAIEAGGVFEQNQDSLPAAASYYVPHAALAKQYGLDLVAYEGGFGADAYAPGYGADLPAVYDFIRRLKGSPRMGVAIKRMIDDFRAAGGTELTYFNDIGDVTWGATPNIYTSSPILEALTAVNAAGR